VIQNQCENAELLNHIAGHSSPRRISDSGRVPGGRVTRGAIRQRASPHSAVFLAVQAGRGIYDRDRAPGFRISLIAIGEVLKTVLVERLFHFSRDKLMTIPAFARSTIGRHLIAIKGDGRPLGCLKTAVKIKL
jgi:hypothetical protein